MSACSLSSGSNNTCPQSTRSRTGTAVPSRSRISCRLPRGSLGNSVESGVCSTRIFFRPAAFRVGGRLTDKVQHFRVDRLPSTFVLRVLMAHTDEGRTDAVRLHHQCHIDGPLEKLERHPALLGRRRQELWIGVRSEPPEGTSEDQS